jgi:hypothetical protein
VLNVRNSVVGAGLLVGAVGGYLSHGSAPVIGGVSAGAQQCQEQTDGGQICWISVWGGCHRSEQTNNPTGKRRNSLHRLPTYV